RPCKFEDRAEYGETRYPAADVLAQLRYAANRNGVRQTTCLERPANLIIKIDAVGQHHKVWIAQRRCIDGQVRFELERGEHHRKGFATSLRVPNQALPMLVLNHPLNNFVDGSELVITADFLGDLARIRVTFKYDEMGN